MATSKSKSKPAARKRSPQSPFAAKALRAIRKAQRTAARENARYGLPLIIQEAH
jgi:hypothetical protein